MDLSETGIYTPKELREILKMSERTYYEMKGRDELPASFVLRIVSGKPRYRYLGSDIFEWINQHKEADGQAD